MKTYPPTLGQSFQHTFLFTDNDLDQFAKLSGDRNAIHLSNGAAQDAGFSGRIAHGVLTLGVFSKIFGSLLFADGNVLLGIETRFRAPVLTGQTCTAVVTVDQIFPSKHQVVYKTEIYGPDGNLALTGNWRLLNRRLYNWQDDTQE